MMIGCVVGCLAYICFFGEKGEEWLLFWWFCLEGQVYGEGGAFADFGLVGYGSAEGFGYAFDDW